MAKRKFQTKVPSGFGGNQLDLTRSEALAQDAFERARTGGSPQPPVVKGFETPSAPPSPAEGAGSLQ